MIVPAALFLLAASPSPAAPRAPAPGDPIALIEVECQNVFDLNDPSQSTALFKVANGVHRVTRESVIRRELLFSEGEPYDPALLSETERNLRRLPFIRKAEVAAIYTSSGTVVRVRTWDSWTLEASGRFNRAGGVTEASLGAADGNLLGYGKKLGAEYSESGRSVRRRFEYSDQQFLRKHVEYRMTAAEGSNSRDYTLKVGRPFYATIARSSLQGGGDYVENHPKLYQDLREVGATGRRFYDAYLTYGYAVEASPLRTQRVTAKLLHEHADYAELPEQPVRYVPNTDQHTSIVLGYDYQETVFIKQTRIQRLSREEDFNMGWMLTPSVGYAPASRALGTTGERVVPRMSVRKGVVSELGHFLFLRGDYFSTYVNGGNGGRVATLEANYFCRYFPRHTVAAHAALDHGWRLDAITQLKLGEDTGLRGYRAEQFQGNRRLLFNLEERMFFFEDFLSLLDGGGVVFFDSGYVWMPEQRFRVADLKSSVGAGLRLGASRSAINEPLRIDVAHALNDNHFPSRWTVSIQAGHAFGPN